ncbi:BPI fold-containing family B member 4-like [Ornithorhynchus anatinus]|uniref:BPI fold-containing family B member 4-like n=1 Tax=Ornithorhynchus anatinus TaxID=9258 RepID=UPI0019D48C2C|nr:BPI fold-containing family B member 4-like [Ornithorhynchus anatinus]
MQLPDITRGSGILLPLLSITNLKILSIRFLEIAVKLQPPLGIRLAVNLRLNINGNCLLNLVSGLVDISVDLRVDVRVRLGDVSAGSILFVSDGCDPLIAAVSVNLLSGILPIQARILISNNVRETLPVLACPLLNDALIRTNSQMFGTVNSLASLGTAGTVRYLLARQPRVTGQALSLHLTVSVRRLGGGSVGVPVTSIQPTLPDLRGKTMSMGICQDFLSAALSVLVNFPPQTLACDQQKFPACGQLRNTIFALAPSACSSCPAAPLLTLTISLSGAVSVLLEDGKASVKLCVFIQIFIRKADGSLFTLLVLKANLNLRARFTISGSKLMIAVTLESSSLLLVSSSIGNIPVLDLMPLINKLLADLLVPKIDGCLDPGVPLPSILGIKLVGPDLKILQGMVLVTV